MERTEQQWRFREGDEVLASDGDKLGKVVAVQPDYVVVEKGFFFPTDYYIPTSAVTNYEDGRIYLNVAKEAALTQGWDVEPTGTAYAATGTAATTGTAGAYEAARVSGEETLRVPVHEEELAATTRERELGEVRVTKDVVAEERTLEVPVTEERVRVERRVVDRPADAADPAAFREGTIEVPVRGEEVELQKRARVAEEVEVGKEAVQRTEQVGGTVRREEVRVEEDVDVIDDAGSSGRERRP